MIMKRNNKNEEIRVNVFMDAANSKGKEANAINREIRIMQRICFN